jgi:hypothetical protein
LPAEARLTLKTGNNPIGTQPPEDRMSHTHEDRVAEQDPRQCAAYGCPMPGSMSSSTGGTNEWFCRVHFGRNPGSWQHITAELNRLGWLVHAVVTMRRDYGSVAWPETFTAATKAMRAAQRGDLTHAKGETVADWLKRLDAALEQGSVPQNSTPTYQRKLVEQHDSNAFEKVEFEVPA